MTTKTRSRGLADIQPPAADLARSLAQVWNAALAQLEAALQALRINNGARGWNVIPSSEGSMVKLAREPRTTVKLSPKQAEKRSTARRLAKEDPQAYLKACRDGRL
ncbi:MAG: hypothetical protein ACLQMH_13480 [Solirubrobacteraceae bacterium]